MDETLTESLKKEDVNKEVVNNENSDRYVKTDEAVKKQQEANQFYTNMKSEAIANEQEEKAEIKAEDFVARVKEAVGNQDYDTLSSLMGSITNKGCKLIGADEQLVRDIKGLSNVDARNAILDVIYPGIENVDLFRDVIKARFNVAVGVDKLTKEDTPEAYYEEQFEWHYSYLYPSYLENGKDQKTAQQLANSLASKFAKDDEEKWAERMQEDFAHINEAWPQDALVHLYNSYLRIPQSQLNLLKAVMSSNSEAGRGAGGGTYQDKSIYHVYYNNKTVNIDREGDSGVGNVTDSQLHRDSNKDKDGNYIIPLDSSEGLLSMDATIIHELGHVVDYTEKNGKHNPNGRYSSRKDFREISGWVDHGKNTAEVVNAVEESLESPFERLPSAKTDKKFEVEGDLKLNDEEVKLAKLIGERIIQTNAHETSYVQDLVTKAVSEKCEVDESAIGILSENDEIAVEQGANEEGTNIRYLRDAEQSDKTIEKSNLREARALAKTMMNVGLINHIQRGLATNVPYFHERFSGMKRQIHEGYRGNSWFSYKNEAWDNGKISLYQFREPCEEFAELYSSYHTAAIKGSYTPPKLRAWFESVGLDNGMSEEQEKEAEKMKIEAEKKDTEEGGKKKKKKKSK